MKASFRFKNYTNCGIEIPAAKNLGTFSHEFLNLVMIIDVSLMCHQYVIDVTSMSNRCLINVINDKHFLLGFVLWIKSNQKQFILPFNGGNTVQVNHEGRINKSIKTPWTALKTIECGSIGAACSRRPWILDYYIYTCHHVKNSEKAVINEKYQYVRIRKSNRF